MPLDAGIYSQVQPQPSPLQQIGAVTALKEAQQRQQVTALQLEHQRRQMATEDALNQAYSKALKPDGSIDMDSMRSSLAGTPAASQWPAIQEHVMKVQESTADLKEKRLKADMAESDQVGAIAAAARAAGDNPNVLAALMAHGVKAGTIDPTHMQAIMSSVPIDPATGEPTKEGVTGLIDRMLASSEKQQKLKIEDTTAHARKLGAETAAERLKLEAPGMIAHSDVQQQVAAGTQGGITPEQQAQLKQGAQRTAIEAGHLAIARQREAREAAKPAGADKLVKVEHKDPSTGQTVIEWLPQSELQGRVFEKGTPAAVENRLASAKAVAQTGNDIVQKLSDPAYARNVGVAMGRYSNLRNFLGNPPPEYSELAGMIESYSLASMGVHGMRSNEGAEKINKMLDQKHTPESLANAIKGLNAFSQRFLANEGRKVEPTPPMPGEVSAPKKNPFRPGD